MTPFRSRNGVRDDDRCLVKPVAVRGQRAEEIVAVATRDLEALGGCDTGAEHAGADGASPVDVARACGFVAVSANDHFAFQRPWLDGPTALASVIERSGEMTLATTIAVAAYAELVARMRADTAAVAALLDELRGRRRGLPVEELGDTFWLLTHPDGYRRLVEEAQWSVEHYIAWIERMLRSVVLGDPERRDR